MFKIRYAFLCLIVTLCAFSPAFADTAAMSFDEEGMSLYGDSSGETVADTSPLIGNLSSGVAVSCASSETAFSLVTQHRNGTKAYAASSEDTSIFVDDVTTVGTVYQDVSTSDTADFSDWDEL
jgi:hypothetical protein